MGQRYSKVFTGKLGHTRNIHVGLRQVLKMDLFVAACKRQGVWCLQRRHLQSLLWLEERAEQKCRQLSEDTPFRGELWLQTSI